MDRKERPKKDCRRLDRELNETLRDKKELLAQAHAESEKLIQDRAQARRQQSRRTWR
jgi:hypothetical protein